MVSIVNSEISKIKYGLALVGVAVACKSLYFLFEAVHSRPSESSYQEDELSSPSSRSSSQDVGISPFSSGHETEPSASCKWSDRKEAFRRQVLEHTGFELRVRIDSSPSDRAPSNSKTPASATPYQPLDQKDYWSSRTFDSVLEKKQKASQPFLKRLYSFFQDAQNIADR